VEHPITVRISTCITTVRLGLVLVAIESIRRQSYADWELIVVAQGLVRAEDRALMRLPLEDSRIRVLHTPEMNRSKALNLAFARATGDVLAITDDDCEVAPDWLESIRREFDAHPEVGLIGGQVDAPPSLERWQVSTCPSCHPSETIYYPKRDGCRRPDMHYMIGANLAMRREVVDRVGLFDAALGPGSLFPACEDQDYIIRAEAADVLTMTTNRVRVVHSAGRRYGWRAFMAHHRNYARGQGALGEKLKARGDELGAARTAAPRLRDRWHALIHAPARSFVRELYYPYHYRRGSAEFRAYVAGTRAQLSLPLPGQVTVVAADSAPYTPVVLSAQEG
jgi:GT2 family glycosyltransferase